MIVTDSGVPSKSATASVSVLITRDERAPEFNEESYIAPTLAEDVQTGHNVITVSGRDRDQVVCRKLFTGSLFKNIYLSISN